MNLAPLQSKVNAADIAPESLAGNQNLTQQQKISEASRQFEAMLLRQILSETQKPVIQSEFTDNSTAAGIYQDLITNQLSDSLSKSDAIGLAKTFEQQLNRPAGTSETAAALPAQQTGVVAVRPKNPKDEWINGLMDRRLDPPSPIYPPIHKSTNPILP